MRPPTGDPCIPTPELRQLYWTENGSCYVRWLRPLQSLDELDQEENQDCDNSNRCRPKNLEDVENSHEVGGYNYRAPSRVTTGATSRAGMQRMRIKSSGHRDRSGERKHSRSGESLARIPYAAAGSLSVRQRTDRATARVISFEAAK